MPSASECLSVSIPSASESLQFYYSFGLWFTKHFTLPSVIWNNDWWHITFRLFIIYNPYFLSLSVAPYSIFPPLFLYWRIMEYISVGLVNTSFIAPILHSSLLYIFQSKKANKSLGTRKFWNLYQESNNLKEAQSFENEKKEILEKCHSI